MFDLAIQADAGSSGGGSGRKYNAPQPGGETFQMKIANNKVCTLFYMKNTFFHATTSFWHVHGCPFVNFISIVSIVVSASSILFFPLLLIFIYFFLGGTGYWEGWWDYKVHAAQIWSSYSGLLSYYPPSCFTVAAIRNKVTLSLLVAVCLLVFALPSKLNVAS